MRDASFPQRFEGMSAQEARETYLCIRISFSVHQDFPFFVSNDFSLPDLFSSHTVSYEKFYQLSVELIIRNIWVTHPGWTEVQKLGDVGSGKGLCLFAECTMYIVHVNQEVGKKEWRGSRLGVGANVLERSNLHLCHRLWRGVNCK